MVGTAVSSPRFRLRRAAQAEAVIDPTDEQRRVIEHRGRRLRVLAGPGTGKTATLVEAVAERIVERDVPPENILVLTFSRRAAAELTDRITCRFAITTREPLVRTLHAYAFSLLRSHAVRSGEPAPRLLAAGESDQMVRELLAGQVESARGAWPDGIRGALGSPASGADELIVFGDPDQSIYTFRGSDPAALRDIDVPATVSLTASHRMAPEVLEATRRLAIKLPGGWPHRALTPPPRDRVVSKEGGLPHDGEVVLRTLPTAAREAAFIADQLRRAHLQDGVPWSEMAVLTRSPVVALPALRRAFAHAGVPLAVSGQDDRLLDEPVVETLISVLRCALEPAMLTGQVAVDLLGSPAGAMDVAALRRLRRALRAARAGEGPTTDLLAAVVAGAPLPSTIPVDLAAPVLRIAAMVDAARSGISDPAAESTLWKIWQLSGLEDVLLGASLRGGRAGQRADATLDAVLAVFGMAAELAEKLPMAGMSAFVDMVRGRTIPGDRTATPVRSADAVAVLSAHAAKGLEWDMVCLAGVAEGRWPVLRTRHSLLGTDEMLDAAAGLPANVGDGTVAMEE